MSDNILDIPGAKFVDNEKNDLDIPGAKFLNEDNKDLRDKIEKLGKYQRSTGLRSFFEGLSPFSVSEPIISGAKALGGEISESFSGEQERGSSIGDKYEQDVAERRLMKSLNPKSDLGAQMAGAAAGALIPTPDKISKLLSFGDKADDLKKITGFVENAKDIGKTAAKSAAMGAVYEGGRQAALGSTGFLKEGEAPSLLETAELGGAIGGGFSALGKIPKIGKAAMSVAFGVKKENIDRYLNNWDAIQKASLPELKSKIDETIAMVNKDVETGRMQVQQAQSMIDDLKNTVRGRVSEERLNIRSDTYGAQNDVQQIQRSLQDADASLKLAEEGATAPYKNIKAPIELADETVESVKQLKKQIGEESKKSLDILDNYKGQFHLGSVVDEIEAQKNSLLIDGKLMTPVAEKEYKALDNLVSGLKNNEIGQGLYEARDLKKLVQQIDRMTEDTYGGAAAFSATEARVLKGARRSIDQMIKKAIPEYAEAMKPVAEKSQLLEQLSKYGDRKSARSALNSIGGDVKDLDREQLAILADNTGNKRLKGTLDEYYTKVKRSKDPEFMNQIVSELPEQGVRQSREAQLQMSKDRLRQLQDPNLQTSRISEIEQNLPEAKMLREQEQELIRRQSGLNEAIDMQSQIKGVTPANSENFIKNLVLNIDREGGIQNKKLLQSLTKLSDDDFSELIKNLATKRGFEGEFQRGSRNVALWSVVGFLGGGMFGGGAGAGFGAAVDKFGPQMAKAILDTGIQLGRNPTIQQIQQAYSKFPPEVGASIARNMTRVGLGAGRTEIDPVKAKKDLLNTYEKTKNKYVDQNEAASMWQSK